MSIQLGNALITLTVSSDGMSVNIEDRRRGVMWHLDAGTCGYRTTPFTGPQDNDQLIPFGAGVADQAAEGRIRVVTPVEGGVVERWWTLLPDGVEVQTMVRSAAVMRVIHPGHFMTGNDDLELLVPRNQGLLVRNVGAPFRFHEAKAMLDMSGALSGQGGLLITQETAKECWIIWEKDDAGIRVFHEMAPGSVEGWYPRISRIYPTGHSVTAVAKRHRRRLIERGAFTGWDEKTARKPILDKLFGSLIAFIGYNQGRTTDYVDSARRLRDAGFESVLYYPVRFMATNLGFQMGGDHPILLSDAEIADMQACGGLVAPWGWTYESLDDGTEAIQRAFRTDAAGQPIANWRIEQQTWYKNCTPYQAEVARRQFAGSMKAMDWIHYDVNAVRGGEACFNRAHDLHPGTATALSARDDERFAGELLGPAVNGNRIVSSEGFHEYLTRFYDIGSNKYLPVWGLSASCIPVPLTDLVFHDSMVHNHWELHSYNATPHFGGLSPDGGLQMGAGLPEKKAALDALYGAPPLVFPFGRQYAWIDISTRKTFSFEIHLADDEVQRALAAALPVTRLHRRIGRSELISFESLSDDYALQTTTFADGTRVFANISDQTRETPDGSCLEPDSWIADPPLPSPAG